MGEMKQAAGLSNGLSAGVTQPSGNIGDTAPGSHGRGAMMTCPKCGSLYTKTMDGQTMCLMCYNKSEDSTEDAE